MSGVPQKNARTVPSARQNRLPQYLLPDFRHVPTGKNQGIRPSGFRAAASPATIAGFFRALVESWRGTEPLPITDAHDTAEESFGWRNHSRLHDVRTGDRRLFWLLAGN